MRLLVAEKTPHSQGGTLKDHRTTGLHLNVYPKVSGLSRLWNIRFTFGITRWEATQRVMAAQLTRVIPFAILARGGQSGKFWIHPRAQREDIMSEAWRACQKSPKPQGWGLCYMLVTIHAKFIFWKITRSKKDGFGNICSKPYPKATLPV